MPNQQSENSYIANEILPLLASSFGYPIHDSDRVKINDVPIFRPSGGRSGSTIDIVYYHNGEPLLLVEAKREHKSHEVALKEALDYLRNFPVNNREFAPSGIPPKFLATTVGKDIKFYKWSIDYSKPLPDFLTEDVEILPFPKLLQYYGFSEAYKARILDARGFKSDFFDELVASFKTDAKEEKITAEIIKRVSLQILNFLAYGDKFYGQQPYVSLTLQGQKAIRDLYDRFDIISSLGIDIAKEFRRLVLRSFQGGGYNQYLTEQCVILFMVHLVGDITSATKVLDFECGSGGFLAAALDKEVTLDNILGIDIDELPYIIAKTYLALYFGVTGKEQVDALPIKQDNGLFYHGEDWDLIIGNPAGGDKYEHGEIKKILEDGSLNITGRDHVFSEYELSIQQAVRSTKVGGKICLVLPEGFFSNSQDEFLRKFVSKHCKVLAIISLPRGVFKKGTSTRQQQRGAQTSSQKMSILYAQKVREIDKENPAGDNDFSKLDYPVFLASVSEPESRGEQVCDWLNQRLEIVFDQWKEWLNTGQIKPTSAIKVTIKIKIDQKSKTIPLFKEGFKEEKPEQLKPKEVKSKTRISKFLEDIFS